MNSGISGDISIGLTLHQTESGRNSRSGSFSSCPGRVLALEKTSKGTTPSKWKDAERLLSASFSVPVHALTHTWQKMYAKAAPQPAGFLAGWGPLYALFRLYGSLLVRAVRRFLNGERRRAGESAQSRRIASKSSSSSTKRRRTPPPDSKRTGLSRGMLRADLGGAFRQGSSTTRPRMGTGRK